MPRQTVLYDLYGTANTSGAATLRLNRLKRGQLLCVQCVSTRNDDNSKVKALVGIDRAGAFYELVTIYCAEKTYTYAFPAKIWLDSDCQLEIRITGAGASGKVYAWVYGYLQEP